MTDVAELIKEYEQQVPVKDLAQRFGIHRATVTALLQRHGVELRKLGLAPTEIPTAADLYRQGWSLVQLGARFGVDSSTVWRALRDAGVTMRPS
jgi:lambda repressor-like predicted transcriptional regulator